MAVETMQQAEVASKISDLVGQRIREAYPDGPEVELHADTSLYDLGLDSLARMEIANRIEEAFHIRFNEDDLYEIESCDDLVQLVSRQIGTSSPAPSPSAHTATKSALEVEDASNGQAILREHFDVELFPECVALDQRLAQTAAAGLHNPYFRVTQRADGATSVIDGRETVRFTSFDYLGLGGSEAVAAAAKAAIDQFGTSASASRLVGGDNSILNQLDNALASFIGVEAAAVFPSGFGTNASLLGHLFGADDLILYDELAHMSIVQGAMLSKAGRRSFPHNDAGFVDQFLSEARGRYRRVVIAIEGVYSMDGDYPDVRHFIDVKKRHQSLLYVDEAHSIGTMGPTGRGICEHFAVDPNDGDLWMGTISKALGSGGGYLAGRRKLIEYLKYTTPSFVFATAASPANAAAALASLQLLQQQPERVERLRDRAQLFLKLASDCNLNTGDSHDTPIIPVVLGDSLKCVAVSQQLLAAGIDAQPILYPAVPERAARVRFFIRADHTEEQICRTVETLARILDEDGNG